MNRALKRLKRDDSIVIVSADKGKAVVVMDKEEYVEKNENHLSDRQTYEILHSNPISK